MDNPFQTLDGRLASIENQLSQINSALKGASSTEQKYYSVEDAAGRLGIASISVYRNIQSGKIPAKRVGGRLLVPGSFIDK